MIALHLGRGVGRHVVGGGGRRAEPGLLLDGEHLGGSGLDGAVHPHGTRLGRSVRAGKKMAWRESASL